MLSESQEVLYKYVFTLIGFILLSDQMPVGKGDGRGKAILNDAMKAHWKRGITPLISCHPAIPIQTSQIYNQCPMVCLQSNPPFRPTHPARPHGFPGANSYPSHGPELAPKPSHWTTSAPAKQQGLKTKMDIWWDTLRKRRWTPPRPPPTGTAH